MKDKKEFYFVIVTALIIVLISICTWQADPAYAYAQEDEIDSNDLYILSHIINAEAGDDNCSHELRIAVGSVVLNRVADPDFPDTIHDVVFQTEPSIQYSPTVNGEYEKIPSEDSIETAKFLLENGSQIPANCVYQANFEQGSGTWKPYETIYGITYICYK